MPGRRILSLPRNFALILSAISQDKRNGSSQNLDSSIESDLKARPSIQKYVLLSLCYQIKIIKLIIKNILPFGFKEISIGGSSSWIL